MKNKILQIGLGILTFAVLMFVGLQKVEANPSTFRPTVQTATATTSLSYMAVGTATTTLTMDTYSNGNTDKTNTAALLLQLTASTTSTVLVTELEYSQDGVDWYKDNLTADATAGASEAIQTANNYSWTFASSTLNGVQVTSQRATKVVNVNTPTRYVRAVFTLTGANGAIWAQFLPHKERNN